MGEFNNDVFEFGVKQDEDAENFNYENISGLGESNYENEDLFDNVPSDNNTNQVVEPTPSNWGVNNFDYDLNSDTNLNPVADIPSIETQNIDVSMPQIVNNEQPNLVDIFGAEPVKFNSDIKLDTPILSNVPIEVVDQPGEVVSEPVVKEQPVVEEAPVVEQVAPIEEQPQPAEESIIPTIETAPEPVEEQQINTLDAVTEDSSDVPFSNDDVFFTNVEPKEEQVEVKPIEEINNTYQSNDDTPDIPMSNTPIEELEKLTEYEEEKIDTTDINSLFEKLSVNVKDASDIFKKNTTLKQKIDSRFEELKSLQGELTNSRKKQMEEIDQYRDEVLAKLTEKKEEIEKRLNTLKELQATLEKEKTDFEEYKRTEQANINKIQKQVQVAYDERREELEHIESVLRKQKDSLDEERNQLSLDKIQYEADKNDLANSLLKFNQIVDSFTNGIDMKEE